MSEFHLSPAYDPRPVEEKWYRRWEEAGLFHAEPDAARRPFCITIPPPNVTGELHIGHALCYEIQDLLGRLRRMEGEAVLLLPGTDHAGIATQNVVERDLAGAGLTRQALGREKFLQRVWEWKALYGGMIEKQFRALGFSFDWKRNRFTMDEAYVEAVLEAFVRFYRERLIYRGERVINWCPRCLTAISDIEVEDREVEGRLHHISYPLAEGKGEIVVATTRPETMLGDTAVAVHPADARYQGLLGKKVRLPLTNRWIPVIADEHARPEFGSGAVKVTPAHDFDDFEVGCRHRLENVVVIDEKGRMSLTREDLGKARRYHGLERFEARERILADLRAGGHLRQEEHYVFRLSHCERCGTVLEPRLSLQWFLRMRKENGDLEEIVARAIEVVKQGKVRFVPERWAKVYLDWMENIRDWCISRQLWWGHRIPAWHCQECGRVNVAKNAPERCEKCESRALRQEEDVLDTWFSSALWPFATLGWPQKTVDLAYFYPTQAMVTSSQIIFLWVARMVMCGLHFMGEIPFSIVYVNPTVLNRQGRRMSKSLGTGVDPLEMTAKYGTDATRFGLICQAAGQEVRFSEERLEAGRNFCNKIWNAARLVLASIGDTCPEHGRRGELTVADLEEVPKWVEKEGDFAERWILGRLEETTRRTREALERYRFDEAARGLQEFFWGDFCDWYLEIAKIEIGRGESIGAAFPRLRSGQVLPPAETSGGYKSAPTVLVQATMVFVLERSLRLLHPFIPFITEEIWQHLPHVGDSLMTAPYPLPVRIDGGEADEKMARLIALVTTVRRMRAERKVAPNEWTNAEIVTADRDLQQLVNEAAGLLAKLTRSRKIEIVQQPSLPGPPEQIGPADLEAARAHTALSAEKVYLERSRKESAISAEVYLSREADSDSVQAELSRLRKTLQQAQAELARAEKNLANPDFLTRAPAEVVKKTRLRQAQAQAEIESFTQAISRLEKAG